MEVKLIIAVEEIKTGKSVQLRMEVKNNEELVVKFCDYHTPFEGVQNDIFKVFRGKKELSYQGIMKKRIPPAESNYKKLKPGETIECSFVFEGYKMKRKGLYSISFAGNQISGLPSSNTIEVKVI